MAYQFTQTGAQIQSILNQVGTNTGDIGTLTNKLGGIVSIKTYQVPNSGSTITVPSNYRGFFVVLDSSTGHCGMYALYATGGGAVNYKAFSAATDITLTASTNQLLITPSSGSRWVCFFNVNLAVSA